jgi:hypothetical protein
VARRHEKLAKWGSQPHLDETLNPYNIQALLQWERCSGRAGWESCPRRNEGP